MNNIVLGLFVMGAAVTWRHASYWLPAFVKVSLVLRRRFLLACGFVLALLAAGFAMGDVIAGRTQIARNPVRYATRLTGSAAHHHDLADASQYWRQIVLEAAFGVLIGASLIVLGKQPQISRHVA